MIERELSERNSKIDSLDGVRGLAALIVVFSHTSNAGMFFVPFLDMRGIGKSGVFLFFLLSAFLLTVPFLKKGIGFFTKASMSHYWQRRFFRIYPLYTLYLLLALVSTYLFDVGLGKVDFGIPFAIDWAGFFKHIMLAEGKGVTWSIAVEFKFYFLLPFLVFGVLCFRSWTNSEVGVVALFFMLMFLSQAVFPQADSEMNDPRVLPYMPIFIVGIFLAVFQDQIRLHEAARLKLVVTCLGYLGVAGLVIMTPLVFSLFFGWVPNNFFHEDFILHAVFWAMVVCSAINVDGIVKRFFLSGVLRFYGALSFSLYLFHPIFIMIFNVAPLGGYLDAWAVLLCSTVASYISFKLLEEPMSKYKIKIGRDSFGKA